MLQKCCAGYEWKGVKEIFYREQQSSSGVRLLRKLIMACINMRIKKEGGKLYEKST